MLQDDGAFAIAQALKANDDIAVTSLNISSNFLTKFGQVMNLCSIYFFPVYAFAFVQFKWI